MTAPGGRRIRVVVATTGDGGDRAAGAVARALRDGGMEVVHAGRPAPGALADAVVQEDADAVGLPVLPADAPALVARPAALRAEVGAAGG